MISIKVSMLVPGGDELVLTANNVLLEDIPERLEIMGRHFRSQLNPEYYVHRLEDLKSEIEKMLNADKST